MLYVVTNIGINVVIKTEIVEIHLLRRLYGIIMAFTLIIYSTYMYDFAL